MNPRQRAAHAYRAVDVPFWVILVTYGLWLVVGVVVALHYRSFDLPALEANLAGFVAGGFAAAGFYLLRACD